MPAESLTILNPFPKMAQDKEDMDLSDSEELASLLAEASLDCLVMEESNPSSHHLCSDEDSMSDEYLMASLVQPPQSPWSQDSGLPTSTDSRLILFQEDNSVSMTEESKGSPPSSKPSTSRYKTELCRSYQISGCCRYEAKCQFAHGPSELRRLTRHRKYKTELCRTYHTTGFCPYGMRCHFIHNIEEEKLNNSKKGQCPPFLRQSISCSGIPSLSSSPSGSVFSSPIASPASLPIFPPISPLSPTNPFGSTSFWTPSPVTVGPVLLGLVTPPRLIVQNPWMESPQRPFPLEQGEPQMADNGDSLMQQESTEESTSVCDD